MRSRVWIGSGVALAAAIMFGHACILAEAVAQEAVPAAAPAVATPEAATPETAPTGNKDRGEIVYRSNCGVCHKVPTVFAKRFAGKDPRVRGVPFEDYIATHHAPQSGPKRDLIAFLKTL
ncbi:MAG: hypothetical protein EXQ88_03745 [Alphaproteobacteria bacterium]|nr:hypothetical protein [Alphaproteobacteria bacterium]